jgi:hypothetical protein
MKDLEHLSKHEKNGEEELLKILKKKNLNYVSFNEYKNIENHERDIGKQNGKIREKIIDTKEMINIAKSLNNK